jgi:AcrR family transcriptional regulator
MAPDASDFSAQAQARMVATAQDLFMERGIALVTLAEVALALRLPVAAIERYFPAGKDPLLAAVIERYLAGFRQRLAEHHQQSSTAVEEMLRLRRALLTLPDEMRGPFLPELAASYPTYYERLGTARIASVGAYMRANLQRGLAEGLYQAGLDIELETQRWIAQASTAVQSAPTSHALAAALFQQVTDFLARVTSPTGALVARRLQEAAPYY